MIKKHANEKGVALLSVLLLIAVMSLAALAMLEMTLGGVQVAKAADGRSRANWQILGAEQAGLIGVQRLLETTNGELRDGAPGIGEAFLIESNGAQISARIEDASNCFNLNTLALVEDAEEEIEDEGEDDFQNRSVTNFNFLLDTLGYVESDAEDLTDTLIDWMDADNTVRLNGAEDAYYANLRPSYRTSGTILSEVSELRAIRGYTKGVVERLSPFICARPSQTPSVLNINTLDVTQAPLLVMAFSGELPLETAQDLITSRPLGGWQSLEDMLEDNRIEEIAPELRQVDLLSISSNHIALFGEVLDDVQGTRFSLLYAIGQDVPVRVVSRSIGAM